MKDEMYKAIKAETKHQSDKLGFNFKSEGHATLYLCELILKRFAGYHISYTESLFLNSMKGLLRNDGVTPTRLGSQLLCEVYYKHSSLQSDGCVWSQKYRLAN